MYGDISYWLFMIPAFILMAITSWYVRHAYNKWSRVRATSGLTGRVCNCFRRSVPIPSGRRTSTIIKSKLSLVNNSWASAIVLTEATS